MGSSTVPIITRDEDNRRRAGRLKQMKRGPGTFVYEGDHVSIEHHPTILRTKKEEPVVDDDGAIATDVNGNPLMRNVGEIVRDHKGKPMLGGPPKVIEKEAEHFRLWGVDFPRGKAVYVSDPALALKLRCHGACRELDETDPTLAGLPAPAPKRRGRPPKSAVVESDDDLSDDE